MILLLFRTSVLYIGCRRSSRCDASLAVANAQSCLGRESKSPETGEHADGGARSAIAPQWVVGSFIFTVREQPNVCSHVDSLINFQKGDYVHIQRVGTEKCALPSNGSMRFMQMCGRKLRWH